MPVKPLAWTYRIQILNEMNRPDKQTQSNWVHGIIQGHLPPFRREMAWSGWRESEYLRWLKISFPRPERSLPLISPTRPLDSFIPSLWCREPLPRQSNNSKTQIQREDRRLILSTKMLREEKEIEKRIRIEWWNDDFRQVIGLGRREQLVKVTM